MTRQVDVRLLLPGEPGTLEMDGGIVPERLFVVARRIGYGGILDPVHLRHGNGQGLVLGSPGVLGTLLLSSDIGDIEAVRVAVVRSGILRVLTQKEERRECCHPDAYQHQKHEPRDDVFDLHPRLTLVTGSLRTVLHPWPR